MLSRLQKNVVIKIKTSETGVGSRELDMLRKLFDKERQDDKSSCVQLLDDFLVDGPNGTHSCIVTELLGPSAAELKDARNPMGGRLPRAWSKALAKQLLSAVSSLHAQGIGPGGMCRRHEFYFRYQEAEMS
jgi:serine/threonine-protein kinase SRPK3